MMLEKQFSAMAMENKQLNEKKVIGRFNKRKLTLDQKRNVLRTVDLIKRKRHGKLKVNTKRRSIINHVQSGFVDGAYTYLCI